MEAILASGHIPAAMEQFSPGYETAWEKIRRWIDESDAFIRILGGRYGSIEPESSKSYVQLEYEYAQQQQKPYFALVVSDKHHDERVRMYGLEVDERTHQDRHKEFRALVEAKHCRLWSDKKDIQAAIFQKLPEWAQREDLYGWIRGEEASGSELASELAKLSRDNRELRDKLNARGSGETDETRIVQLAVQELESREPPAVIFSAQAAVVKLSDPQPQIEFQIGVINKSSIWSIQPTEVEGQVRCDGSIIDGELKLMSKPSRFVRSDTFGVRILYFPSSQATDHIKGKTEGVNLELNDVRIHFVLNPDRAYGHPVGGSVAVPISRSIEIKPT
jgi:hypothetical protein